MAPSPHNIPDFSSVDDWFVNELEGIEVQADLLPPEEPNHLVPHDQNTQPYKFLSSNTSLAVRTSLRNQDTPNHWDPRLVIDLALEMEEPAALLERYSLTEDAFLALMSNPVFRHEVASAGRELREKGLSFQRKAAVQAETYLGTLDDIVHDTSTPASTRLACIQSVVRWGKLEPEKDKDGSGSGGHNINVQINF